MKISRVLGRVEVTSPFLIFLCAYYYFDPAGTFVPFLLSVTLHELGHLIALLLCRAKVHKLCLTLSGITIQTVPMRYSHEIFCAAAGPLMNFLLALICLHRKPEMALLNLGLLLYNLLPLYPLDGGRILRGVLELLLRERAAYMTEKVIGLLCFLGLLTISVYLTYVLKAGFWPLIVCCFLLLRTGETIFPKKAFCS